MSQIGANATGNWRKSSRKWLTHRGRPSNNHTANRDAQTRPPAAMPYQNPRKPFPAWRLPNGIIKASDDEVEKSIESCENWEWVGGGLVFVGVVATVLIAAIHPPYDSFWEQWGSAIADSLVAVGVAAEIKFGQMAGLRQNELRRRSDEKVAEANKIAAQATKDAADARERTAEIERITAWRRLTSEQRDLLRELIAPKASEIDLLVEYQRSDPEAYMYSNEFVRTFSEFGVTRIRYVANEYLSGNVFGLHFASNVNGLDLIELYSFPNVQIFNTDLAIFRPMGGQPTPNLYLFVGPKLPADGAKAITPAPWESAGS